MYCKKPKAKKNTPTSKTGFSLSFTRDFFVTSEKKESKLGALHGVYALRSHLLGQPTPQRLLGSLHATLGLRRCGRQQLDVLGSPAPVLAQSLNVLLASSPKCLIIPVSYP